MLIRLKPWCMLQPANLGVVCMQCSSCLHRRGELQWHMEAMARQALQFECMHDNGLLLQATTLPLDTAKVRLQLQAKGEGVPKYK